MNYQQYHVLRRTIKPKISLEFYRIHINKKLPSLMLTEITAKILVQIAITNSVKRISLALSPLIHPVDFVESLNKQVYNKNLIPYFPLSGLDGNIFETAKEIGLEKYLNRIEKLGGSNFSNFNFDSSYEKNRSVHLSMGKWTLHAYDEIG